MISVVNAIFAFTIEDLEMPVGNSNLLLRKSIIWFKFLA